MTQNRITHINLVVDASYSMDEHAEELIKVVDGLTKHLAARTQPDEEIRISVYDFADDVRCLIYEKDVLRLPSIAQLYRPRGNTALIDAAIVSLSELAQTAQLHGEHAFLTFLMTDGQENRSRRRPADLKAKLASLPDDWTVACMVPNAYAKHEAQSFGFAPGNIAIWNPDSHTGVEDAGAVIRTATENFMSGRARGVRATTSLFSTGIDAVNKGTVRSTLDLLDPSAYRVLPVTKDIDIKAFFASQTVAFRRGANYYQFTKRETIQASKEILVREKATGHVYGGQQARDLLGLQMQDIRDTPGYNPEYEIYVQSTSPNRKLVAGTNLLVLR